MGLRIKKIGTNVNNLINVEGIIDVKNKNIYFSVNAKNFKEIFQTGDFSILTKFNIFIIDENDKEFSCFNCIAGYSIGEEIKINIVSTNLILENILTTNENMIVNNITFKTTYPRHSLYGCYFNDFSFNYTSQKKITIKKVYSDQYLILELSINSKVPTKRKTLDNTLFYVLELICLLFGSIPQLKEYKFIYDDRIIIAHFEIVDKYIQNEKSGSNDDALMTISKKTFTTKLLKDFINFRKKSSIIYDMFLINLNSSNYNEIINCMLVQLIEGTYKTLTNQNKELWEILDYYFMKNNQTNMLLNKKDKASAKDIFNTPIFLYKAKNHRHYLSHLNMNEKKDVFNNLENNYAKFKLILCLRLIYMQYLNIIPEKEMLEKNIKSIDKWGKRYKIKI